MMKLGCYLFMAIVGLIGFMNLANTMISILQIVLSLVLSSNLKKETLVEKIRYQG